MLSRSQIIAFCVLCCCCYFILSVFMCVCATHTSVQWLSFSIWKFCIILYSLAWHVWESKIIIFLWTVCVRRHLCWESFGNTKYKHAFLGGMGMKLLKEKRVVLFKWSPIGDYLCDCMWNTITTRFLVD